MNAIEEAAGPAGAIVSPPGPGRFRRWAEGIAFVAVWTGLGWVLRLNPNAYLLLGVPLTVAFQRSVRREPIRAMWVREAPPMGRLWVVPAAVLVVLPAISLGGAIFYRQWIIGGWMAAGIVGAVGAGYALVHLRRSAWRPFVMCQLTAGLMGIGLAIAGRAGAGVEGSLPLLAGLHDFLLYFPVGFALEEVSFRGMLDSHLHRPGERFGLTSALLGSVLWGIWHLPTLPVDSRGLETAIGLMMVHALIGVPLAIAWRRSGNLAVPAFTHAMLDAIRNTMLVAE